MAVYAFPVQLVYDDGGSGERVVLIHGHPFDRTLWEPPQLAELRRSFRVLAPDLRGRDASLLDRRKCAAEADQERNPEGAGPPARA